MWCLVLIWFRYVMMEFVWHSVNFFSCNKHTCSCACMISCQTTQKSKVSAVNSWKACKISEHIDLNVQKQSISIKTEFGWKYQSFWSKIQMHTNYSLNECLSIDLLQNGSLSHQKWVIPRKNCKFIKKYFLFFVSHFHFLMKSTANPITIFRQKLMVSTNCGFISW